MYCFDLAEKCKSQAAGPSKLLHCRLRSLAFELQPGQQMTRAKLTDHKLNQVDSLASSRRGPVFE